MSVWDEASAPSRNRAPYDHPRAVPTANPAANGIANASSPRAIAARLYSFSTCRSSSSPATNIRYRSPSLPMTRPMRPGIPRRLKTTGPSRITQKSTKNSNAGPSGEWISDSVMSALRKDQRHVVEAGPEPARGEPADRPVRLEGADGRVDDLDVRRSVRQD